MKLPARTGLILARALIGLAPGLLLRCLVREQVARRVSPALHRTLLGRAGEALIAERLVAAGHHIQARNLRTRHGELDLLARTAQGDLLLIEVKTGVLSFEGTAGLLPRGLVPPATARPGRSLTPAQAQSLERAALAARSRGLARVEAWLAEVMVSPAPGRTTVHWSRLAIETVPLARLQSPAAPAGHPCCVSSNTTCP